jgi:hypothetical protein
MRDSLLLGAAAVALTIVVGIILSLKRGGSIYRIYRKAVQLENGREYKEAVELYELILEEASHLTIKNRDFIAIVSQRLKTLQASMNFESRFVEEDA